MISKIEKMQSRIMAMAIAANVAKIVCLLAIGWLSISAIIHVERYGLKHLIEILWLGPGV